MGTRDKKYNNLLLELKYLYAKIDYSDEIYQQAKRDNDGLSKEFWN